MLSADIETATSQIVALDTEKARFPNLLAEFVYKRTYSRWIPEKGRREHWPETVQRYVDFISSERNIPEKILAEIHSAILNMEVMPSMRALWSAGDPARRDNTCMYNCSFVPIDSLKAFPEITYILMQGTGAGFSVEQQFIGNLPVVGSIKPQTMHHVVADSAEGWSDALYFGMKMWFQGHKVEFDYSKVRPAGAILKTKGGRASGPDPLIRLMKFAEETILGATGRKLSSLECHDIVCCIGDIVVSGGVRRSALISISDVKDLEMRHAKDWSLGDFPLIRHMSNNSAFYEDRPEPKIFWSEWDALVKSGSGERGFLVDSAHKRAPRPRGMTRTNPCGEIMLRFTHSTDAISGTGGSGSFCNLSAAVMRPWDTVETMANKIRIATWIGAIQSTFTHFPYLRNGWAQICQEDRLLGVDITGQADNPELSNSAEAMMLFNRVALGTAEIAARYFNMNMPAAITCGKPSGNSSQFLDCGSGFHNRFSPFYFRHVRINADDPLFLLIRDAGIPVFKENGQEHLPDDEVVSWVARFPVKAPEGSMLRSHETAIEQLERYLQIMRTWMAERGHNQSATIYVREGEWQEVGEWVWKHFDEVGGLSFLPYDGGKYRLAPYEEINEEEYIAAMAEMPEVDFSHLQYYETYDMGEGSIELACKGGACEI